MSTTTGHSCPAASEDHEPRRRLLHPRAQATVGGDHERSVARLAHDGVVTLPGRVHRAYAAHDCPARPRAWRHLRGRAPPRRTAATASTSCRCRRPAAPGRSFHQPSDLLPTTFAASTTRTCIASDWSQDRAAVQTWLDAYERLWREPGTDRLGEVFSDDATYLASPWATPRDRARRDRWVLGLRARRRRGVHDDQRDRGRGRGHGGGARRGGLRACRDPGRWRDLWIARARRATAGARTSRSGRSRPTSPTVTDHSVSWARWTARPPARERAGARRAHRSHGGA